MLVYRPDLTAEAFQFSRIDLLSRRRTPESESRLDAPGLVLRIACSFLGDTFFSSDAPIFCKCKLSRQFLYSPSPSVRIGRALFICSIRVGSTRLLTYVEGMFKLPKGHLNLVSKSALMRKHKTTLDDHLAKLPVQFTI